MAYNYYPYPQPYQDRLSQLQTQYQQTIPQVQQMAPQPQINQGLLWVQGEAAAKSYLVAPNTTVLLMDADAQKFYLKSTDSAGMPNLRTFEYVEVFPNAQPAEPPINLDEKFVTRAEFESIKSQYEEIINKLQEINEPKKRAKGVNENEPVV